MKVGRWAAVSQSEVYGWPTSKQGDLQPLISSRYQARRRRAICDHDRLPWLRNHPPDGRTAWAGQLSSSTNTHLITHQASRPITGRVAGTAGLIGRLLVPVCYRRLASRH